MEAGPRREATDSLTPLGPTAFGRYTILGRLGSGGMADALLAMMHGELGFQKLVVLKRMHASLARDEHFVKMFLDEARLAARLNHPNVVQTAEVGEVDGQYFIAMEYLEGQSLDRVARRYVARQQAVPPALLLRVLCDALEGLHYAHELRDFDGSPLSVVHRDVTPSNLFVSYDGAAKVLDFGIAKAATQDEATRTGMLKGKLAYMSPEQFYPDPIDRRSDLWSMGVVVWELSTGRRLFKGQSDAATYTNIVSASPPPLARYNPEAPAALDAVIARALARKRDERYPTADAMRRDLEAVLRDHHPPTGRTEVAAELREVFGETMEENRRAVRAYARLGTESPSAVPLGLSSLGELKPGAGGTLAPTATGLNVRDLGLLDQTPPDRSGVVAPMLTQGTRVPSLNHGAEILDSSEPTQVNARSFTLDAFDVATPIVASILVESGDPEPAPPQPLRPPRGPIPIGSVAKPARPGTQPSSHSAVLPPPHPTEVAFGPLPAVPTPARSRGALAVTLLVAALLGGVGAVGWFGRNALVQAGREVLDGPPPDRMRQGSFRLRVESEPAGASVFDGAQRLGVTPFEMDVSRASVWSRPRRLELRREGFLPTSAVQVNTLEPTATLRVTLAASGGNAAAPAVLPMQVTHRPPSRAR